MKNPRSNLVVRLSALIALSAITATASRADEPAAKRPAAFKLNAQVNQHAELNPSQGDMFLSHLAPAGNSGDTGGLPTPGAQSRMPGAQGALPRMTPAMPQTVRPNVALSGIASASAMAQPVPPSYLNEYDVDWSSWISQMAARWHYNLRRLEAQSNVCFVTERPALIQFTCAANGQVGNFSLKQSSGIYAYDQLQMLALSQVIPLPPFPKGTRCATITLVQGWESHTKKPGESGFDARAFGRRFPMEKVQQWVRSN
ncbi:MAG: TonB C-terminal domain-containing protein [Candidatus Melainabacteria bacterium]|nr:TonB C-terminal domain-containing protein [Candidatus Melainabacteria bacterium]